MPSFNRVTLMGNLTRDPQLKQLPSSTTVAEFGLAISRRFRTQTGDDREEVCFVDCTAFGRQAETIGQYMQKGRPILVEGRLKYDTWDDKNGGKRSKLSVVVENFQFLGRGAEAEGDANPFGRQSMFGSSRRSRTGSPSGGSGRRTRSRPAGRPRPTAAAAGRSRRGRPRPAAGDRAVTTAPARRDARRDRRPRRHRRPPAGRGRPGADQDRGRDARTGHAAATAVPLRPNAPAMRLTGR
jgi:single-strand DNA-binding protein